MAEIRNHTHYKINSFEDYEIVKMLLSSLNIPFKFTDDAKCKLEENKFPLTLTYWFSNSYEATWYICNDHYRSNAYIDRECNLQQLATILENNNISEVDLFKKRYAVKCDSYGTIEMRNYICNTPHALDKKHYERILEPSTNAYMYLVKGRFGWDSEEIIIRDNVNIISKGELREIWENTPIKKTLFTEDEYCLFVGNFARRRSCWASSRLSHQSLKFVITEENIDELIKDTENKYYYL